jgi:hypothetical protein
MLSQAQWARQQGVSKPYVSKLVKTGKIKLIDGKIDPVDAEKRLRATRDPLKSAHKAAKRKPKAAAVRAKQPERFADEILSKDLADQLLRARIKREREAGLIKELDRRKREGELVDALDVRNEALKRATEEREALMSWPNRISSFVANDLGVEERQVLQVLRKYVRQHLSERSADSK